MKHGASQTIATPEAVRALFAGLTGSPREIAGFAYLDPEWRLLGLRHSLPGAADCVDLPLHDVARDAVAFGAAHVVMAHNHPSGDPAPSRADIAATRRIARALDALGVGLAEHVVLAARGFTSLRREGLL